MEILGKNDTGFGFLFEYDAGYVSPKQNQDFILEMKDRVKKKAFDFKMPTVTAVMQKYGVENKNGRVYPEAILKREANEYLKLIEMGASAGETDHPECFCGEAEILTSEGWKSFRNISGDEKVYTLNSNGEVEIQQINKKIDTPYKGKAIKLKGLNIDCTVTLNHRFLIVKRNGEYDYVTAQDILDGNIPSMSKCYIPKSINIENSGDVKNSYFTIKGIKQFNRNQSKNFIEKFSKDLTIDKKLFSAFLGIYLAEGHVSTEKRNYGVILTQKKEESKEKIENLLNTIGWDYKKYLVGEKAQYVIHDVRLHKYLKKLGKAKDKYIPSEIKRFPTDCLNLLIEWYHLGDGRTRYGRQKSIFSTSKKLMEDFQEVLLLTGKSGNITIDKRTEKNRVIVEDNKERVILAKNSNDVYNLNISNTKGVFLDKRFLEVSEVDYEGNVYCVNVENSNFYVKQNGKAHWSGNSAVISIKNTSMRVTNLWWEGRTLMGEIYLPITRGFIERGGLYHPADKIAHDIIHGFQYGVSSRGVGSVEQMDGKNIVQEDFELICWDFVTTPSTHGSWVSPDKNDLTPYIEGTEPSAFEKKGKNKSYAQTEKDWFKMAKTKKNVSVEDAISNFMRGYK
jgi:hypothetical protein